MSFLIYRGTRPSDSALSLRNAMREVGIDAKVNRRSNVRPRTRRMIINWGTRKSPGPFPVLNSPSAVANAADKLRAFRVLEQEGVRVPPFWDHADDILPGSMVVARTVLNGHSGEGIVVCRAGEDIPAAPLYVQYIPKKVEYRVHVVGGEVIFVQQKRKKNGWLRNKDEELIRSHHNGWVFAENSVEWRSEDQKSEAYNEACRAVSTLGLDFGAVDLILCKREGKPYILEVNTAPALVSTRLKQAYVNSFRRLYDGRVSSNN